MGENGRKTEGQRGEIGLKANRGGGDALRKGGSSPPEEFLEKNWGGDTSLKRCKMKKKTGKWRGGKKSHENLGGGRAKGLPPSAGKKGGKKSRIGAIFFPGGGVWGTGKKLRAPRAKKGGARAKVGKQKRWEKTVSMAATSGQGFLQRGQKGKNCHTGKQKKKKKKREKWGGCTTPKHPNSKKREWGGRGLVTLNQPVSGQCGGKKKPNKI